MRGRRCGEKLLEAIVGEAVGALCLLAEEIEVEHRELAERIWDLTNEKLEVPVREALR